MKHFVVTIGRAYGSKGHEIGEKLAKTLGVSCYDKELIELAAEKSGLQSDLLEKIDEMAAKPFYTAYPQGKDPFSVNDQLFRIQSAIIREIAERESCVIIGRCANYVLSDRTDCLHVYIYENLEKRIQNIMESQNITDWLQAVRIVKKNDKMRRGYYQYYTDWKWGESESYNLLINSELLGVEGTVAMLKNLVEIMQKS